MTIRPAVPLALALALAASACGDADEGPEGPDEEASVTAEEVRRSAAAADTAAEPESPAAADEADADAGGEATARSRTLYSVQVGAFVRDENARGLRQRLEDAGLPVWSPTTTVRGRSFERVRIGAAATPAEARRLARRVEERFGGERWIAPVPPGQELPGDVARETERLLDGAG